MIGTQEQRDSVLKNMFRGKPADNKDKKRGRRWVNIIFWVLLVYLALSIGIGGIANQDVLEPTIF